MIVMWRLGRRPCRIGDWPSPACIAAGVFPLTHWLVAHSSRGEASQQHEWFFVLRFSAVLLAMGIGMLAIASQVASPAATRTAVVLGVILTAASLTNIVEDGFHVGPVFLVFVAELVFLLVGCLALALFILAGERGSVRLWAAVPIATVGGILLYVELGGPVLAIAWIGAAVLCGLRRPSNA